MKQFSEHYEQYKQSLINKTEQFFHYPLESFSLLAGGKFIRSSLFFSANTLTEKNLRTAFLIELIHAASLIHDDIVDESALRRGKATLYDSLGTAKSTALGYYFLSTLQEELLQQDSTFYHLCFHAMEKMGEGQIDEIQSTAVDHLTIEQYMRTIGLKTASLFQLSCGWIDSDWDEEEASFGYQFGLAFQILDDIQDVWSSKEIIGKPTGQDKMLGIKTLPGIFAHQSEKSTIDSGSLTKAIEICLDLLNQSNTRFRERRQWVQQLSTATTQIAFQIGKNTGCNNNSPS